MRYILILIVLAFFLAASLMYWSGKKNSTADNKTENWNSYGGNEAGNRYSPLTQININNVKNLQLVWSYETGENKNPDQRGITNECQPIEVNGILYGITTHMKLFALNACDGKEIWKFDPFADPDKKPSYHPARGVVYWEDGDDKRIIHSVGSTLYAINALTGKPIKSFGNNGTIDLHIGLGDKRTLGHDVNDLSVYNSTPGVIYKDILITGSSVSENGNSAPGYIRAFNVRTGKLLWVFHTIPLPGEYGYQTWPKDAYKKFGGVNCWAGLVLDEKRGIVYAGTGTPSVDFYGGDRTGKNLFANCVIALNAKTGKRIWHFQIVHHDLWDRDMPCQPNLITVKHEGRIVDAVAQATKDGLFYVFDRDTGIPLFPVEEVNVPVSPALPGEHPWPTQPVPVKPAPFAIQELTEATITNRTPEAHDYVLKRFRNSLHGSKYMPPSIAGTLYFGLGGGAEWGGNASDPDGILYQNSNNMLWWITMRDMREKNSSSATTKGESLFNTNCAVCHGVNGKGSSAGDGIQPYPVLTDVGKRLSREQIRSTIETGRGRMPSFQHLNKDDREAIINFLMKTESGTKNAAYSHSREQSSPINSVKKSDFPYVSPFLSNGNSQFLDHENYPAVIPPWGTLNAIDLNTGEYLWQVPLGEYPELTKQGIAATGTENHGGPIVTAGGLVFIAAAYDEKIRAFDKKNGKVVWEYKLPAGGFATPITYMVNGRQYVVIAAGGGRYGLKPGGSYVAFALP